jgi:uncharacterized protein
MDLTLSLTHNCNLACTYCYAGEKSRRSMTWETARKGLDFAFSFYADNIQLGFFGGEPLLEWELLQNSSRKATEMAEAKNIPLKKTVTTNGSLITQEKAEWLLNNEFFPAISIDGNQAMHDITRRERGGASSFEKCIKGLDIVHDVFPAGAYEVIIVIDPSNIHHMTDSIRFLAEEKDIFRIAINPNFYTNWEENQLTIWEEGFKNVGEFYLERYRNGKPVAINFIDNKIITRLKDGYEKCDKCGFGEKEIAIAPSGNLYPCERLVSNDTNNEMCIGNIFGGFDNEKRKTILKKRGNIDQECGDCAFKNRCMNWCCCINYATTGEIDKTDGIVCFHERTAITVADNVGEILFKEKTPDFLARFYYET